MPDGLDLAPDADGVVTEELEDGPTPLEPASLPSEDAMVASAPDGPLASPPADEPFRAPLLASPAGGRAILGAGARGGGPRRYPRLTALVASFPAVPLEEPQAFFPRRPLEARAPRRPSTARPEVEGMLRTMADGLLIGGDERGTSEVRVMLSDEFFRGTELRIAMQDRRVRARFLPPDLETFRALDAEKERLREHLRARGFVVSDIEITRP